VSSDFEMPEVKVDEDVVSDIAARVKAKKEKIKADGTVMSKDEGDNLKIKDREGRKFITDEEYEGAGFEIFILQMAQRASNELVRRQRDRREGKRGDKESVLEMQIDSRLRGVINMARDHFEDEQIDRMSVANFGEVPEKGLSKKEIEEELKIVEEMILSVIEAIKDVDWHNEPIEPSKFAEEKNKIREVADKLEIPAYSLVHKFAGGSDFDAVMLVLEF